MRAADVPLGAFDRDEVLLSEPNRDRLVADFGRAKTKKKVLSLNSDIVLRGLVTTTLFCIDMINNLRYSFYSLPSIEPINDSNRIINISLYP